MVRRGRWVASGLVVAGLLAGCVQPAPPAPATQRTTPPPWPAPRDAVSYIDAAGLRHVRLDATENQHIVALTITIDGQQVPIAAGIGIDKVRAIQAPVHTHDDSGQVWLEGEGTSEVTLAKLFVVWGVRFDARCLGQACGTVTVSADGAPVANPLPLRLVDVLSTVTVVVSTR